MPAKKSTDNKQPAKPTEETAGTPIVVRRQIMTQDPTEAAAPSDTSSALQPTVSKVKIKPLSEPETSNPASGTPKLADKDAPETNAKPAEPVAIAVKPEASVSEKEEAKPAEAKPEPDVAADEPAKENEGFALDGADDGDPSKHPMDEAAAKAEKEAQEKQAALDKLVKTEMYFLLINAVEKRRAKLVALLILLLLLVAAGAAAYAVLQGVVDIPSF